MPMSLNVRWLCLLTLVFVTGCIPMPPKGFLDPIPITVVVTQTAMFKVELDVFSGRPNPQWLLPATDEAYLLEKLQNLPEVSPGRFAEPLGYRGIVVYVSGSKSTTYHVWRNFVIRNVDGQVTAYHDDNSSLEMWLLMSGKPFLQADLFETIQKEIERERR
jgi:hypothetical protein